MTKQDFLTQIDYCNRYNKDKVTVHQLHTFLNEFYDILIHFKREITIAAYSKSRSEKFAFLSTELIIESAKALNNMDYRGAYSKDNENATTYLIGNILSTLKDINTSLNKFHFNANHISFDKSENHSQKVLKLKESVSK